MMRKILVLFLSLLLFSGYSFQPDNLISSPPTLILEQKEHGTL